jgi:CDP-6-deoxy-D-xylo-4-hexulose-3-dehydrase
MHIPLNKSSMGEEEKNAAKAVIDSDNLTMGKQCRAFEREFADYLGVEHAVMVNSGSSANLIALFAMADALIPSDGALPGRIRPGSEVIVPALTWSTTIWPVLQVGAKPVFVDCDPHSLQMEPDAIEAAITPETSAIVVVHVLGGAVNVTDVEAIARRRNLWLFEDTCEALGAAWNGKRVGSFGHLASFSFYFSHHITTIEGGMVVTNDARLADLLRAMRAHGWVRDMEASKEIAANYPHIDPRFLFLTTGFNVRPTEINAAIGLEQLKKLPAFNDSRRETARRLERVSRLGPGRRHLAHTPRPAPPRPRYTLPFTRSATALTPGGGRVRASRSSTEISPASPRSPITPIASAEAWGAVAGLRDLLGHPPVRDRDDGHIVATGQAVPDGPARASAVGCAVPSRLCACSHSASLRHAGP